MGKKLSRYFQAWSLRKEGKTLHEIGEMMGFTTERSRILVNYVSFSLRKKNKDSTELRKMIKNQSTARLHK